MSPILVRSDDSAGELRRVPASFGEQPAQASKSDPVGEPPRPPALPASVLRLRSEQEIALRTRRTVERRSMWRGLILLAVIVIILAVVQAGLSRTFPANWWRFW